MEGAVIIATEDNTQIYVNNELLPVATINTGKYFVIPDTKYSFRVTGTIIYTSEPLKMPMSTRFWRVIPAQEMK
jgi:hypothetical protein